MSRFLNRVFIAFAIVSAFASGSAHAQSYIWTGAVHDGLYNTAGNWNPAGVPGAGDTATVDGTGSGNPGVTTNTTIGSLTMSSAGTTSSISIPNGITLTVTGTLSLSNGTVSGAGTLVIAAGATLTSASSSSNSISPTNITNNGTITTTSGSLTLQGTTLLHGTGGAYNGNLTLDFTTFNIGAPLTFGATLNIGANITLNGAGPFTLTGTINNNILSKNGVTLATPVTIASSGVFNIGAGYNASVNTDLTNNGTINIANTSALSIASTVTLTNSGTISLNTGKLQGAGTLANAAAGTVTSANATGSNTISVTNVNNNGTFTTTTGTLLFSGNTLAHLTGGAYTGTFMLDFCTFNIGVPLTFGATLNIGANIVINGGSTFTLTGTINNNVLSANGITFATPITIASAGVLNIGAGYNCSVNTNLTNNGTINIANASALTIPTNMTLTNALTINLNASKLQGAGTLVNAATGTLASVNPTGTNTISVTNVTNNGMLTTTSGTLLFSNNTLTHATGGAYTGTFMLDFATFNLSVPLTFAATLNIGANVTLNGTGPLTLTGTLNNNVASANGMTLSAPTSIASAGIFNIGLGYNAALSANMTNNGTINLQNASTLTISANITLTNSGTISLASGSIGGTNGTLAQTATGVLTSSKAGGTNNVTAIFTNAGAVTSSVGTLNLANFTQSAGTTTMAGGNLQGTINITGGALNGAGSVTGDVALSGTGSITPATSTTTGAVAISGKYTQSAGTLNLKLGSASAFDQVTVGGVATLAGTLAVTTINSYVPAAADSFKILTFASRSGAFATVSTGTTGLGTVYDPTDLTLSQGGSSNPVPTLTAISPATAIAGGSAFTLTATGTNFINGSVIQIGGVSRTTTFVSATSLTALILASDIATAGTPNITVMTPGPGGGTTTGIGLVITNGNPVPSLDSISPATIVAGSAAFTLTVTGSNFVASSVIQFNGSGRSTTFVSATSLTTTINSVDVQSAGSANITVVSPTPGGGTTAAVALTITTGGVGSGGGTMTFVSPPVSSLNPCNVGDNVTFSVAAMGGVPAYAWDLGDGITAFGSGVTHTYTVAGIYAVTVKANNGPTTISATILQAVNNPNALSGSVNLLKGNIKFNFNPKSQNKDTLVFTGTIPLPASFNPLNKKVTFNVGDIEKTFTLDAKATSSKLDKNNTFKLAGKMKLGVFTVTTATFTLTLKTQNLFTDLSTLGFENDTIKTTEHDIVAVPIGITVDGNSFINQVNFNYSAKQNVSGSATLSVISGH